MKKHGFFVIKIEKYSPKHYFTLYD